LMTYVGGKFSDHSPPEFTPSPGLASLTSPGLIPFGYSSCFYTHTRARCIPSSDSKFYWLNPKQPESTIIYGIILVLDATLFASSHYTTLFFKSHPCRTVLDLPLHSRPRPNRGTGDRSRVKFETSLEETKPNLLTTRF